MARRIASNLRYVLVRATHRRGPARVKHQLAGLTRRRQHDAAVALARQALLDYPDVEFVVRQVRASATKAGAISLVYEATALQADSWPTLDVLARLREQEGRLKETSAEWSPHVPPAPDHVGGVVAGRVVHVLKISMPHRQSGYSVRTQYSLAAAAQAGWEPVGVTAMDFPANIGVEHAPETEFVSGVRHRRLLRAVIPSGEPVDRYLDAWAGHLAGCVAQERPAVLHAHSGHRGYETALVALAVGEAGGIPVVYEVRGFFESLWTSDTEWAERSETYDRRWETEQRCMRRAAAVVTLSESMKADIVSRGIEPQKVHVVPNGVDSIAFAPRERSAALAQRWGLTGRFVFGYVSNLDHFREGHELLIEAAALYAAQGIDAVALIVGDGSRADELKAMARRRGVESRVVFTGKVPHSEVLDYYALYDVFVIPRVDERAARLVTPLKPFEAMAAGIPVVVSDLPALTEITGAGSRGRSFAVGDAADLVATLETLRSDDAARAHMRDEALRWVRAERSWAAIGRHYAEVYASIGQRADLS